MSVFLLQFLSNFFCLLLFVQVDSGSSKSVPIVITVIVVILLSLAGGIVFIKKYVCGGRLACLLANMYSQIHDQNLKEVLYCIDCVLLCVLLT